MDKGKLGKEKEEIAVKFLKEKGYKILDRNYFCKLGEIDIIAEKKGVKVFVEVKFRKNDFFGLPREAVNIYKQRKIQNVATFYLRSKGLLESKCRFDVIEILDDKITHLENCF